MQVRTESGAQLFLFGCLHNVPEGSLAAVAHRVLSGGLLRNRADIGRTLSSISGNYAFIVRDRSGHVLAVTDKVKSYPLLYSLDQDILTLGNDSRAFTEAAKGERNSEALTEFKMSGYVSGRETLYGQVSQLQAGDWLCFDERGLRHESWYTFYSEEVIGGSEEEHTQRLDVATHELFQNLTKRLRGRPVLLPLSAGNDSRLVLCMLRRLGYDNIQTFTFGLQGNHEARWARDIASTVQVPWTFVPYSHASGRDFFRSETYQAYSEFVPGIVTPPFILDFPALSWLLERGKIPEDAVVINGLSGDFISGSHEKHAVFGAEIVSRQDLLDYIVARHYSLWSHLLTPENVRLIKEKVESLVPVPLADEMTSVQAVKWYEAWEWACRQTTFVLNSQRAYDFLGLSWELPLWDDVYLDFWSKLPAEQKIEQRLYKAYLSKKNWFGLFREVSFPRHISPAFMRNLQHVFARFGQAGVRQAKKYLSYWQDYSYYYALYPYRTYLQDAHLHRGAISYHVKHYLESTHDEQIST